jgi:hypothetical protein
MAGKKNLDDRQIKFLEGYLHPDSNTYTNAYQSAIKAGYEHEYAKTITAQMPEWLSEAISKEQRLLKAEKVFDECLELEAGLDSGLLRIKQDTAKFLAETIGKDKGYTKRGELTGKNGQALEVKWKNAD